MTARLLLLLAFLLLAWVLFGLMLVLFSFVGLAIPAAATVALLLVIGGSVRAIRRRPRAR